MTRAVLVNGVPASGKSTVAQAVAARLGVPRLEMDAVKEVLFDELGDRDGERDWGRALGRASRRSIWALLAGFPPDSLVVVDAWLRMPPHDDLLAGLADAGVDRWVELWCRAAPDVLVARYEARDRHPGHPTADEYVDELRELAGRAGPTRLAPHLVVETDTGRLDLDGIVAWVHSGLDDSDAEPPSI